MQTNQEEWIVSESGSVSGGIPSWEGLDEWFLTASEPISWRDRLRVLFLGGRIEATVKGNGPSSIYSIQVEIS